MRHSLTIMTLCVISPLLLSSCWWNKEASAPMFEQANIDATLARYSSGEAESMRNSLHSEKFSENDKILQKLLEDATGSGNTSTGEIIDILMFQLQNSLNQGTYEYVESEGRDMADKIIGTIIKYDPTYAEHPYILASQGYAEEINKNYTGAQEFYEKAFERAQIFSGSTGFQAQLLNQIGHLQSLLGNTEKAYELTYLAYELEPRDFNTSLNIARYLAYSGSVKESMVYFEYAAKTPYAPMRAEVYFSMSSLMSDSTSDVYDLDRAIEYANLAIENNPNYPMGYYALARAYYMMNDTENYQLIEDNIQKSINLNPNSYNSYELLGLAKFDKGKYEEAIKDIEKAIEVIPEDMLLMDDQRVFNTNRLYMLMMLMEYINSKKAIDESFRVLFLSDNYGADNIILQLERPNNGFLKAAGDRIRPLFNN